MSMLRQRERAGIREFVSDAGYGQRSAADDFIRRKTRLT